MISNKQKIALSELTDLNWLKKNFFSNEDQKLELQAGDKVTTQGEINDKMFFVESGSTSGYFKPADGEEFKVFSTGSNMIVGIYSFFSHNNCSYTTVKANEDTIVYYVRKDQIPSRDTSEYCLFLEHILPVVVNEIYLRQMLTINSISEKESAVKKLFEHEKMATLGQLAAGLAHELNNAVSVIQSKTDWITQHMKEYMGEKDSKGLYPFFLKSLEKGQTLSSAEIRNRKEEIQQLLDLRESAARKLAKMNLTEEEINTIGLKENQDLIQRLGYYWDAGLALHDINLAATHTSHVVQSIKELGAANRNDTRNFNLLTSIKKTLSLLSNVLRNTELTIDVEEDILLSGREGDFMQVWVNLIKNAAESLSSAQLSKPEIVVSAKTQGDWINVSIADNGIGIDEESMSKIFQPNYTTKVSGLSFGLGLGLSIVQKIVTIYGGNIRLECNSGWTNFIVELPNK
ncbi:ATP-binding protein [Reichenbachiella sp.]|uniref:ATP-binding protein n=1 Tax=Reichenbachiella sp. TaxID=2184521 RepID=UPI003297768A